MRISTAIGFAVAFRLHSSIAAAVGAFGLCVPFGFSFAWVFITMGLVAGNAQAAQGPVDARLSAHIRLEHLCTREQHARLDAAVVFRALAVARFARR
jgi:hypothetical protein